MVQTTKNNCKNCPCYDCCGGCSDCNLGDYSCNQACDECSEHCGWDDD